MLKGEVKKIEEQITLGNDTVAGMKAIGISEKKYKKYKDAKGTTTKDKGLSTQEKIKDILAKAKGQTVSYVDMASEGISERAYTKYKVENKLLSVKNDKTPLF